MNSIKKALGTVFLGIAALSAQAQSDSTYIYKKDGSIVATALADIDSVSHTRFDANKIVQWVLDIPGNANSYAREANGITWENASKAGVWRKIGGDNVSIEGANQRLYAINKNGKKYIYNGNYFSWSEVAMTYADGDGNQYSLVTIGTQKWLSENLRTTKYNDGTPITKGLVGTNFYLWYNNDSATAVANKFGALYSGYIAVNKTNICPVGTRVPTQADFETLIANITNNWNTAGKELKASTTWSVYPDRPIGTNSTGFDGRGTGTRGGFDFTDVNQLTSFGTSTSYAAFGQPLVNSYVYTLAYHRDDILANVTQNHFANPIRCIKE